MPGANLLFCVNPSVCEMNVWSRTAHGTEYTTIPFYLYSGIMQVIEQLAPRGDEIVLPKTSSSVFLSTNIDYILRWVEQLFFGVSQECSETVSFISMSILL